MSDDWAHSFCFTCDKQTDGTTYCSQSCRLADYERASMPSLEARSTSQTPQQEQPSWSFSKPPPSSQVKPAVYLPAAFDFSTAYPFLSEARTATTTQHNNKVDMRQTSAARALSPSSSHSSLTSIQSVQSTASASANAASDRLQQQLSERARRELLAYARSFESVRLQRRRSY